MIRGGLWRPITVRVRVGSDRKFNTVKSTVSETTVGMPAT
jgi:hypothetical protein